jgi:hypothetical protein
MTYAASAEPLTSAYLLRVHPAPGSGIGDPFAWSCAVQVEGEVAILKGALSAPPLAAIPAIRRALRELGVRRVRFVRRKASARVVEFDVR